MFQALVFTVLGGAWRRWFGHEMEGFFAHRWVKLLVAIDIGFAALWFLTHDLVASGICAALLAASWTPPAQFGKLNDGIKWGLIPRYGIAPVLVAVVLFYFGHHGGLWYAPVGVLAPVGYQIGKYTTHWNTCWTCVGEVWLGAIIYGGLFIIAV